MKIFLKVDIMTFATLKNYRIKLSNEIKNVQKNRFHLNDCI